MGEGYVEAQELQRLIVAEIFKAMGWSPAGRISRLLAPVFFRAVRRFAEVAATCDRLIAEQGLTEAARWTLAQFTKGFLAEGTEHIPREGPLLIACNHPGTVDSLVIVASVARQDLKVVAGPIPFMQHLPNVSRHLIYSSGDDVRRRAGVVRQAIHHLEDGGALLLFARGHLEPDPACMPGAEDELAHWSRSLEIFLRSVPQASVVVGIVSGVLARESVRHPITWVRRGRVERQRLAMIIQFVRQMRGRKIPLVPRVTFGEPLPASALQGDPLPAIIESARRLLARHRVPQA
ncbi:MAG: 1-acyl-sn-glycerol-3-phosphate acyltransferase [Candidatus Bipolaricaulota bacterium]